GKLLKAFSVKDLLNGIERPEERQPRSEKERPCSIFVCYHSEDEVYKEALNKHLTPLVRLQKVTLWDKSYINAGEQYEDKIFQELEKANLVLCLISSDFIADDFCYSSQLKRILTAHKKGVQKIIPIKIRNARWQKLPLAQLKAFPDKKWVGTNPKNDDAWVEVVEGVERLIEEVWKGQW
ncbi:MAG: toll/interleukin-1 receptor domain-containing protein, partial [Chitinophagales bacterium]